MKFFFIKFYNFYYHILRLKAFFYANLFKECGKNLIFYGSCNIKNPDKISVGNNVTINDNAYLNGQGYIKIGDNVSISANAIIVSTGLDLDLFLNEKKHICNAIIIGDNVQLGAGCIVLPGIVIGNNVVVGAGSVVTKKIENNCVVAGNPAKIIRKL